MAGLFSLPDCPNINICYSYFYQVNSLLFCNFFFGPDLRDDKQFFIDHPGAVPISTAQVKNFIILADSSILLSLQFFSTNSVIFYFYFLILGTIFLFQGRGA